MRSIGDIVGRIGRTWKQKGALATGRFLLSRIFRYQKHVTYEADCRTPRQPTCWTNGEQILELGPDNLDKNLTPELRSFLGGEEAYESLEGVRSGDRLFVVKNGKEYVHRGYILFHTRQTKILGDPDGAPLIANCATARDARGKGLYRRALNTELVYLHKHVYQRAIIETHPENVASRRGIEAAGFALAWETQVWIVFNWFVVQRIRSKEGTRLRCFHL